MSNFIQVIIIVEAYPNYQAERRFIPYFAMHEFEALLFSDVAVLGDSLSIKLEEVKKIIDECGSPEQINNKRETAPSKRLDTLKPKGSFRKTIEGITIAEKIGIDKMREHCPLFDAWLKTLESKVPTAPQIKNRS